MARSWYAFIGGNPIEITNYYKATVKHSCLCGDQICAIYAVDAGANNLHPPFPLSDNMKQYIQNALITGQIQPEIPYNTRKYVYLKH
ncbi:hypothetical protein HDF26_000847 [Pedobacter cryoconitis]|uniref:hypothetical protein n=1 Tax=Pedobacter cryoconitis TaxID=188932 RepID=UPI00161F7B8F|nr:hypothetical protein [Pedobacter cryoconitis]MBB6270420.1 hypothetical protein [Pedobacter cryoconitis]